MSVLALNAGSTSLKFGLFADHVLEPLVAGDIDWAEGDRQHARLIVRHGIDPPLCSTVAVPDDNSAAACAIKVVADAMASSAESQAISLVGHRVVHGGTAFRSSVLVNAAVKAAIGRLCELAPLHNPAALRAIEAAEAVLPGVPQVAVFDTAFYAQLPPKAYLYPLPYHWYEDWGIRRFGFHGLSHSYCATRAAELLVGNPDSLRLITCHLGGGCSATAVRGGIPVSTTMGFSPLDGLMMGTRCGAMDPGLLLHVQRQCGLSLAELDHALNYSSGLLGVSGVSPDLARIEAAAVQGNTRAQLAFDLFADRVRHAIGALATSLGGLDALIFTDRIGENSPALRATVCQGLEFMGLRLDAERNGKARPDADIAAADSPARILVLHTREELMVAREARAVIRDA